MAADDEMADTNDSQTPYAGGQPSAGSVGGMLAPIRETGLAPLPQPYASPSPTVSGDQLAGGVDYRRLGHAFRRCWVPAVALGVLLGTTVAVLTWVFMPRGYEAVAWLRVGESEGMLHGARDSLKYEVYRKTQVQLIKGPFVLLAALRQPGIIDLETVKEHKKDPVGWLTRYLQVTAPIESEVIQVRLRGERPVELAQIVNAVVKAYLTEIGHKEKTRRMEHRDQIETQFKDNMREIRQKNQEYNDLAKTLGTHDSVEVLTQRGLLLDHLGNLRAQMTVMKRDLAAIDAELAVMDAKARGDVAADDPLTEKLVDAMMSRDPQVAELLDRLAALDEAMTYQAERSARGGNDPAVKRLESLREGLLERIEQRKQGLRPRILAQLELEAASRRPGTVADGPAVLRVRREILVKQIEETDKEYKEISKEAKQLGQANADLAARKQEIEQLQKVTDQIGIQLQASEVDIGLPDRVQLIEEANVPEGSDELFRMIVTVLAGLAGLAVGSGSVVLVEYLRDRVSCPEEVSERIGVRVVGTLPPVSRSRKQAYDIQIAECVDGIRTLISQTGRDAPKVILVTSAIEHEGKTTFAAQLAASLARADRRTLILDGDLRHPNVHLALQLDLRSGFPELLRGEAKNDEVVQPTSIDGLFAVTGGSCDYASITALSKPELARVIKGFRESFDHIVIDAGPALAFADALLLGQQSDVAIVATMRDVSRVPLVMHAIERLRSAGVRVLGTVVNGVIDAAPRRIYASPVPAA